MPSALVHGVRMTTLTLGISTSANYGDPECLANPRCADLFKDPKYWGSSDFYGIGGSEQVRLSLGTIRVSGKSHTLFVGLDAEGHTQLASHVLRRVRRVGVRRRIADVRSKSRASSSARRIAGHCGESARSSCSNSSSMSSRPAVSRSQRVRRMKSSGLARSGRQGSAGSFGV